MDHICLVAPNWPPSPPCSLPPDSPQAAAPPPLLYSSWIVIQASQWGARVWGVGLHPASAPPTASRPLYPAPRDRTGQDRTDPHPPPKPEQRLTKHFLFSPMPPPCQPAKPLHQPVSFPLPTPAFSSKFNYIKTSSWWRREPNSWSIHRSMESEFVLMPQSGRRVWLLCF